MPRFPMGVDGAQAGGHVPYGHPAVSPEMNLSLHLCWSCLLLPMEKPLCPLVGTNLRAGSLGWLPASGQLVSWVLVGEGDGGGRDFLGFWRLGRQQGGW